MTEEAEYQAAVADLEECYKAGLRAFAKWFAREWQQSRESWIKAYSDPVPSDDWFVGWNAAVAGIEGALDVFLGDMHS